MQRFMDLRMDDPMIDALWARGADGRMRSPLDGISDEQWFDGWMPGNDEDFGNPGIAELTHENPEPPFTPDPL